ncbi:uncharacterized protein LOC126056614 isoform X3 [Helicoverpa armigera]|uniref:uncharacterized protein LOC126056614 isoform X3 n=1 Tax=Helicoverpa armigera TaxID=29058 RepID=UPI0030834032
MSELITMIRKRSAIKSKLTIFANHLKLIETSKSLTELQIIDLQCRLRKIEPLYEEFDSLQTEIEVLSDEPPVDEVPAERVQFDNDYYTLVARAKRLLAAGEKASESVAEFSDAESGLKFPNQLRSRSRGNRVPLHSELHTPFQRNWLLNQQPSCLLQPGEYVGDKQRTHHRIVGHRDDRAGIGGRGAASSRRPRSNAPPPVSHMTRTIGARSYNPIYEPTIEYSPLFYFYHLSIANNITNK